jgi:hypothetical protein
MATATKKAKGEGKAKGPDVCRLTLSINGTDYRVRPVAAAEGFGVVKAARLRKLADGDVIDVARTLDGFTCTCADATFRHDEGNARCKHARALAALGLI